MLGQHNRAMTGQGRLLVENVDLTGKRRMIDLGGGAASYSIALCEGNPDLESIVVDQKEPVALARGIVEEHGLQGRISFLEGDFFELALGGPYDVVLISGVILIKPDEDCRRLLKLAHDIMAPGGIVIVQDYIRLEDTEARSRLDTLEHLYVMVAFDPGAGDREGEEVVGWLKDAGFINTKIVPLPTQLGLVIAQKRA
jgi:predicted O-methyltransferase YrrM